MSYFNPIRIFHRHQRLSGRGVLAMILGGFLVLACPAEAQERHQRGVLLDSEAAVPMPPAGRSAIVFLKRSENAPSTTTTSRDQTVSVFIDGTYHASLPRASWAYAELCPGAHLLKAVRDKEILTISEDRPDGLEYKLPISSTSYFEVRDDGEGIPELQSIQAEVATTALEQLPRAVHTISRLQSKECVQALEVQPLPAAAPEATTSYTLQASTFFDFDDSRMRFKGGNGQVELDQIIEKMHARYMTVQNIEVIGYADPTGSASYNLTLSRKRAETIAGYLAKAHFASATITARGMGATNLAVPDCATWLKTPAEIHACNEPNRRVELVVHGQPKN